MTILKLEQKVITLLVVYSSVLISLIILLISITIHHSRAYKTKKSTIDNIQRINFQITEKEIILNKKLALWREIPSADLHSSKYIDNLHSELNKLYEIYYILKPEISISVPQDADISYKSEHVKVIKSSVILNFSSISDKHIFLFLQSIPKLPGYIMVKSILLKKEKDLDDTTINEILNGNMIEIIKANIVFDWYMILSR